MSELPLEDPKNAILFFPLMRCFLLISVGFQNGNNAGLRNPVHVDCLLPVELPPRE